MVRALLARRHKPELLVQLQEAETLDARLRDITTERDTTRAKVNDLSKQVGTLRRSGDNDAAEALMAQSRALGDAEQALVAECDQLTESLRDVLLRIPNTPHPDAVDGAGDHENPTITGPINMPASFPDYQRVPHWETATALGILDNERAVKISGAMFTMQRGAGATMARALCQLALDRNADAFEILSVTTPEQAPEMLQELVRRVEGTIAVLGLPYRIIEICTGDLGQSHHRSFDIEVYVPGGDSWLEVSSISWFSDYQARRADIRFKRTGQKGTEMTHTLNASALAVPRVWAAIIENNRQQDGSVIIPEALHPYMRGITRISPK